MTLGKCVIRGVICGCLAGLAAGLFAYILVEPTIDRAVGLESAARAASSAATEPEVFSRPVQHLGLVVATTVLGAALGGLFGIVFFVIFVTARGREGGSPWAASLGLGGALFLGFYLVPFLRYPANPPGAGDPETINQRSLAHLVLTALGLLGVLAAWRLAAWLREKGVSRPIRQTWTVLAFLVFIILTYAVLPSDRDPVRVPASLLWDFRLFSLATQAILWLGLAWSFGLWSERAVSQPARRWRPGQQEASKPDPASVAHAGS